jgi:hypothetical protein
MEVIMIIVIVSVFMAAIGIPLLSSLRESDLPEISTIAYFLGLEKLVMISPPLIQVLAAARSRSPCITPKYQVGLVW